MIPAATAKAPETPTPIPTAAEMEVVAGTA